MFFRGVGRRGRFSLRRENSSIKCLNFKILLAFPYVGELSWEEGVQEEGLRVILPPCGEQTAELPWGGHLGPWSACPECCDEGRHPACGWARVACVFTELVPKPLCWSPEHTSVVSTGNDPVGT